MELVAGVVPVVLAFGRVQPDEMVVAGELEVWARVEAGAVVRVQPDEAQVEMDAHSHMDPAE